MDFFFSYNGVCTEILARMLYDAEVASVLSVMHGTNLFFYHTPSRKSLHFHVNPWYFKGVGDLEGPR